MKKKILVIDDDKDIVDLVRLVLETENFEVETVTEPQMAYERAKEWKPDAIFLDILMPKIDGWEVFKQLRGDASFAQTPIAMFTAKSQRLDEMVGLHIMKADAYITKPFGKQELVNKAHELISKSGK